METTLTRRGQTVVPAAIRKRHRISEGDHLVWMDDGTTIKVVPVPANPVRSLRGAGKGENLLKALAAERRKERERES